MALVLEDRVRETTTVVGTGDANLLGAVTGYQAFSVIGNTNTCYYTIADQGGPNWEVGIGTYSSTGPVLARTTVLSSNNSGNLVSFTAGTKDIFVTYPSEKAVYLDGSGNLSPAPVTISNQLSLTNASNYNLYASGAGANYMAGALGIGVLPPTNTALNISYAPTSGVNNQGILVNYTIQSNATTTGSYFSSGAATAAAAFTLPTLRHFYANQGTIGASSAVTNQFGYIAGASLIGATNNYGFYGDIPAATGRYNLYMSGTAANYLAGQLLVGTTTATNGYTALSPTQSTNSSQVSIGGTNTFAGTPYALLINTALTGTAATTSAIGHFVNNSFAIPASGTITSIVGIQAQPTLNTTSAITTFSGNASTLAFGGSSLGNTVASAYSFNGTQPVINGSATTVVTLASQYHAGNIAGTANLAITTAVAFYGRQAASNTGVTTNYNLYMAGTAANYFGGDMQFNKTVTAGGTTGAQTISKNAGTVNFAAAATSLVVTNTLVTTSSIIICTVGTNDTTMKSVSAVAAAGSVTIFSNAAATAETRVNFIVIN